MESKQRKTFTFLRSYYEAASAIQSKEDRADFYHAIFRYVFDGEEIALTDVPLAMFMLAKPNIDTSLKKAEYGRIGGMVRSENEAKRKHASSKIQAETKQASSELEAIKEKDKGNIYIDIFNPPYNPPLKGDDGFEKFWKEYPRKVGKDAAKRAFEKAIKKADIETLVTAVQRQKCGTQWTRDNGQYIPHPATWLNQGRWQDEVDNGGSNNGANMAGTSAGAKSRLDEIKDAIRTAEERRKTATVGKVSAGGSV